MMAIGTNAGNISTNAANIVTNSNDILALQTTVGAIQSVIAGLRGDVASNRKRIDQISEGISMAMALQNPDLFGGQQVAFKLNYGNFEGSQALGLTGTGVLAQNLLGGGEILAISGGVGIGLENGTVGGQVGLQIGW